MQGLPEVPSKVEVTQLLKAWGSGDDRALERLISVVENELHRLAHRCMAKENPGHTLQTTALVNEVYLRLVDVHEVSWQDRAHFFRDLRQDDASHPHRFCSVAQLPETRRRRVACVVR